jgi:hypothetical protein
MPPRPSRPLPARLNLVTEVDRQVAERGRQRLRADTVMRTAPPAQAAQLLELFQSDRSPYVLSSVLGKHGIIISPDAIRAWRRRHDGQKS